MVVQRLPILGRVQETVSLLQLSHLQLHLTNIQTGPTKCHEHSRLILIGLQLVTYRQPTALGSLSLDCFYRPLSIYFFYSFLKLYSVRLTRRIIVLCGQLLGRLLKNKPSAKESSLAVLSGFSLKMVFL